MDGRSIPQSARTSCYTFNSVSMHDVDFLHLCTLIVRILYFMIPRMGFGVFRTLERQNP